MILILNASAGLPGVTSHVSAFHRGMNQSATATNKIRSIERANKQIRQFHRSNHLKII